MTAELDYKELVDFKLKLLEVAKVKFPRETKNFMGRAGNKLRAKVKNAYKTQVGKKTGNLLKGVSRGRAYIYQNDKYQIRVKNKAPHAHLIEHGHVMKDKDGNVIKNKDTKKEIFVPGRDIVGPVYKDFDPEFVEMADKYVDDLLDGGKALL